MISAMGTFKVAALLALFACHVTQISPMDIEILPAEGVGEWSPILARTKRAPVALSYDIDQQFDSGLGQHHVEHHALALTHSITHGIAHPLPHGLGHAVSTTAGHGLLQTHPTPPLHHHHAHHIHHLHKVGYGHGYSLGAYKGYGPSPHSVLNLHYGGFGAGLGYGGHGHGHGFIV